jgi:phosphoribosylaminoimidazole carboxylase (NCAIR synthetase)
MKVGIIGGGQLGWMLIHHGLRNIEHDFGQGIYSIEIYDPNGDECCCGRNRDKIDMIGTPYVDDEDEKIPHIIITKGDLFDGEALKQFEARCDVLFCEIEHFDSSELKAFQNVEKIRNKIVQKQILQNAGVPVVPFDVWRRGGPDINMMCPVVIKAPTGGYDGKGVFIPSKFNPIVVSEKLVPDKYDEVLVEKYVKHPFVNREPTLTF